MVGDARLRCDCCGARETPGGCVRRVIYCDCTSSGYKHLFSMGDEDDRCVICMKCPVHCQGQNHDYESGGLPERLRRARTEARAVR